MMDHFAALILGVIEGFTEFLPISSTAHLILAADLLRLAQSNFAKTFEIAIQSGAILAVLVLYWRKFLEIAMLKKLFVAFLPTAVIGLAFYKFIKEYLLGNMHVVLGALAAGGAALIVFEYFFARRKAGDAYSKTDSEAGEYHSEAISYPRAFCVGLFQSVAMIPGVSRSAATIIGGMLMGVRREVIVEFSFLLAVPTMLAATGLDLLKNIDSFSVSETGMLATGLVASFVTAVIGIKFLLRYIKGHTFTGFGIYRLALVAIFLLFI